MPVAPKKESTKEIETGDRRYVTRDFEVGGDRITCPDHHRFFFGLGDEEMEATRGLSTFPIESVSLEFKMNVTDRAGPWIPGIPMDDRSGVG